MKSSLILCYGYVAKQAPRELVLARLDADILRNVFFYFNTKVRPPRPARRGGWQQLGPALAPRIVNARLLYFVRFWG